MSRAERFAVLAVGPDGIDVLDTAAAPRSIPWRQAPGDDPAAILDAFRDVVDAELARLLAGARLDLWLDDAWLRWASVPWSGGQWMSAAQRAQARLFLDALTADAASVDRCAWDDAGFGAPRMAVGAPSALVDGLAAHCAERGLVPERVLPRGVGVWNALDLARGDAGAVLIVSRPDHVVFLRGEGGVRQAVAVVARGADRVSTEVLFRRLCLRDPAFAGTARPLLVGADDEAGTIAERRTESDGLACAARHGESEPLVLHRRPPGLRGWRASVLLAAVALLAAGIAAWTSATLRLQAEDERGAAQRRADAAARPVPAPRVADAAIAAANQAVRQLNVPVVALLRAARPSKAAPVFLLGIDLADAGRGGNTVRIAAEADDGYAMADYVQYLRGAMPFRAAWLVRHDEIAEEGAGEGVRFVVEAEWRE